VPVEEAPKPVARMSGDPARKPPPEDIPIPPRR